MPAYFDSGFSVREPMWHGQGLVLDDYPEDWADARKKAGLTWEPVERLPYDLLPELRFRSCVTCGTGLGGSHLDSCGDLVGTGVLDTHCIPEGAYLTPAGVFVPITDHKLIARSDTGLVLGVRSEQYSTIYHARENELGQEISAADGRASMEEIIDAFQSADGKVRFETAGSCREGRQVWALIYLDEPYTVPGDTSETLPFVALLNNHGGGSCTATATQVRVVCWNTFQMALAEGDRTGMKFTFRHFGDVAGRIGKAKETIAGLRSDRDAFLALAAELTKLNVTDAKVAEFLTDFLPSPREQGEVCTDRVHNNVEQARSLFKHLYFDSATTEGIRGTSYGLLQAGTEYLDHARAYRSQDSYLGRSILHGEPLKGRLLTLARGAGK